LLGLEHYSDSRVVEPGEEDKIDYISDVFVDTGSQIENETGGIRHIPGRNEPKHKIGNASNAPRSIILFHDVEIRLRLIEGKYGECILWKR